jgi:hypothetical protein
MKSTVTKLMNKCQKITEKMEGEKKPANPANPDTIIPVFLLISSILVKSLAFNGATAF